MRYRQARLSILNCQRLGSQVLSVYHSSPNKAEGSEMWCLMPSRLDKQSVSRQMVPTAHQRGFHEDFMNKLGRERGPLQSINFRLISPAQRLRGYAPNGINSLRDR